jgi:hypothetical protein
MPDNAVAASVFANPAITAVWSYDPSDPAAVNGWLVYDPANPLVSNLAMAAMGQGYFVRANAAASLTGTGTPPLAPGRAPPSRSLSAGWNLVGSYATSSLAIDDAFASIGWAGLDYTALFSFDPFSQLFTLPRAVEPASAFWIFLPAAKLYAPSDL